MRKVQLARPVVEGFYAEHKHRSFFGELVDFMCSGPVVILVLEGEGAVLRNREIMGATDPAKAADGTLRKETMPDLLHLSPAAYRTWAEAMAPVVDVLRR